MRPRPSALPRRRPPSLQRPSSRRRHAPTPRLLPTIEPPPPLPAFPPPPAVAYPTFAPSKLVAPTLAPPTLVTSPARQDFLGPDIVSTHGGNGLRFVESGFDRTPGEDRQYKSVYSQETAGCVDWQVDLPGVEPAGTADIEVVSELLGPNDEVLEHLAMEFELSRARLTAGFPWATDGWNQATGPPANVGLRFPLMEDWPRLEVLNIFGWNGIHIHTGL